MARAHDLNTLSVRLADESIKKSKAMMRGDVKNVDLHGRHMDKIFDEMREITDASFMEGGAQ